MGMKNQLKKKKIDWKKSREKDENYENLNIDLYGLIYNMIIVIEL